MPNRHHDQDMSEASSSSGCKAGKQPKHAISFLLNPEPQTRSLNHGSRTPINAAEAFHDHEEVGLLGTPKWTTRIEEASLNICVIENQMTNPASPMEITSSATQVGSAVSLSGDMTLPCGHMGHRSSFIGVTGESPNHEGYIEEHKPDGTRHISLDSGELITSTPRKKGRPKKRRKHTRTNLQQKRASMVSRIHLTKFSGRSCCKKMRCFDRVDEQILRHAVRETLLMLQPDRKALLRSWLIDGIFVFSGRRVCSAFLATAFGFSRDLQRSVKAGQGRILL